ncbi:MAG: hypothetical protein JXR49_16850 [Acidobacteria bacterium]|nr:hypothetical protein [Acidobacteriota bacterium]
MTDKWGRIRNSYNDVDVVKSWIEPPAGLSMSEWVPEGASIVEKNIKRSGGSIGEAIARAYSIEELLVPDRLNRVLTLIRLSFKHPGYIIHLEDRNPRITLLLLFALKENCKDMKLKEKIRDTEKYINSQAANLNKNRE